jgi:aspartyl-tRNA(Asn)/glutamyl-tRNA(Gln) amidotransferase subunit B
MTLVKGKTGDWEVVIGLEIHAQVSSESKLFSRASTEYGGAPNSQVSFIDAAMPGMLPVLNEYCVEQAVRTGLGLHAKINKVSVFDRKNYFYADLPQGYQISQFYKTIVGEGYLEIDLEDNSSRKIRIRGIHLEQDAGKSMHDQSSTESFIDLNRCGIALMEIVTQPDLRSSYETSVFIKKLRNILRYLGTCDGNMEKGSLRCDANISIRRPGEDLGTRCEIKNLNSIRNVNRAIDYEVQRQIALIEKGEKIAQETRLFNTVIGETKLLRSKENSEDYRYFPDPDLLPIELTDEYIDKIRANLPELPDSKKNRYMKNMELTSYEASILSADKEVASYFEKVAAAVNPKLATNWITAELFGRLNKASITLAECKVTATKLIGLIHLIEDNTISGKIAKELFDIMFETGEDAAKLVEEKGLKQIIDTGTIEALVEEILANNPDKVEEYKGGKEKLFGFFVGQVMKHSGGKMNPKAINDILKSKLSK